MKTVDTSKFVEPKRPKAFISFWLKYQSSERLHFLFSEYMAYVEKQGFEVLEPVEDFFASKEVNEKEIASKRIQKILKEAEVLFVVPEFENFKEISIHKDLALFYGIDVRFLPDISISIQDPK